MQTPALTQPVSTDEKPFFAALMTHLMDGAMIPKVQVERSIGPVIGFFLADALSTKLKQDIAMLCPEFPIQKAGNKQSTNIDWLMFNHTTQELLLVELKTTDTTFSLKQVDTYRKLQDAISENSAAFLIKNLTAIGAASKEPGKYQNALKMMTRSFDHSEEKLRKALDQCKQARVLYLAPKVSKPENWQESWAWLSFEDLPQSLDKHPHAEYWPTVRNNLLGLDKQTRNSRNGKSPEAAREKYYSFQLKFVPLLERCQSDGASLLVGLENWRIELPKMTLEQLRARPPYKCDQADDDKGNRNREKNWIPGDQFLAHVIKLYG